MARDRRISSPALLAALRASVRMVPRDLKQAALAHVITMYSGDVANVYTLQTHLERADGSALTAQVVQGASFRTVLRVVNRFTPSVAPGALVTVNTVFGKEHSQSTLEFNAERKVYVSPDLFDTDDKLGVAHLELQYVRNVAPYGPLRLSGALDRSIGFGINVQTSAKDTTGQDVAEGAAASVGTEFNFDVTLYRSDRKRFTSGDFDVTLRVLDSSRVVLHTATLSGKSATELNFSYALSRNNLPPGRLTFRFEVRAAGNPSEPAHTVHETTYQLNTHAVVADVTVEGAPHLGQTLTVSASPSAFPDKRAVHAFDASTPEMREGRKFFMDLRTRGGVVTDSVQGESSATGDKYVFALKLAPELKSLGTHHLAFRYVAADGKSFDLPAYDTKRGELVEDTAALSVRVNTKLQLVDVEDLPTDTTFQYGNEVVFSFKVKDAVSGQFLSASSSVDGSVLLVLSHKDSLREFISVSQPAVVVGDKFLVNWKVTPNAVRGAGTLALVARGRDGSDLALEQSDGTPLRLAVVVGGEIEVKKTTFSTANPDAFNTILLANFSLTSAGHLLENTLLAATLRRGDVVIARDLPVSSTSPGVYEVSWSGRHSAAPSGIYSFDVYRESDCVRLAESRVVYTQMKRENPSANIAEPKIEPLFSVDLSHTSPVASDTSLTPQVVAILVLVVSFALATRALLTK